jgi:hypothetical protein
LYDEDAYISYFFNLANINRFFETNLSHMDALTLPERSLLRQDLSGSYNVTSAKTWFALLLCRASDQSLQYLHSTHTCYCAVIISINDFSSQVL